MAAFHRAIVVFLAVQVNAALNQILTTGPSSVELVLQAADPWAGACFTDGDCDPAASTNYVASTSIADNVVSRCIDGVCITEALIRDVEASLADAYPIAGATFSISQAR